MQTSLKVTEDVTVVRPLNVLENTITPFHAKGYIQIWKVGWLKGSFLIQSNLKDERDFIITSTRDIDKNLQISFSKSYSQQNWTLGLQTGTS